VQLEDRTHSDELPEIQQVEQVSDLVSAVVVMFADIQTIAPTPMNTLNLELVVTQGPRKIWFMCSIGVIWLEYINGKFCLTDNGP
jgi:hypothetical protein